jgi:hypothetical protein
MLKELLHVHLVHNVKTILSLSHVEDGLGHELVQNQNIVLLLKEKLESMHKVVLEKLAFCNERINLFLFNFPTDSVDQKSNFDRVVLRNQWVTLRLLRMKDILVDINQQVHLLNG